MKQVVQHVRKGDVRVAAVERPSVRRGSILVRVHASVISAGTERSGVSERKQSLVTRARKNPEIVSLLMANVRSQGVAATYRRVMGRLETVAQLGYSCAGVVEEIGGGVEGWSVGDKVACSGAGYANHAEFVSVPKNLCARVPEAVPLTDAAYATISAIALQGVRQTAPAIGETVVVIGLGLVGQITVQILRAAGCVVVGVDPDSSAVKKALESGAAAAVSRGDDVVKRVRHLTGGIGADAVVITAATPSDDPVRLAGEVARDRGRVVLVGDVGLSIPRAPYYLKELDFRLSRSYGPGRYDPRYEEEGVDYPVGYVRWTEQRNLSEVLRLMSTGFLRPSILTTHTFEIDRAHEAFTLLEPSGASRSSRPFGIVLRYAEHELSGGKKKPARVRKPSDVGVTGEPRTIGFVGAGSFAQAFLLPALKNIPGVRLKTVCTASGVSASNVSKLFGFSHDTTNIEDVLSDKEIGSVFIASRHHLHASQVVRSLQAGKNVFVEKPLVMLPEEMTDLEQAPGVTGSSTVPLLMVGFNRRFAPSVLRLRSVFEEIPSPMNVHYRVNAGMPPRGHWAVNPNEGGGRIVGEVCHFIDTIQFLTRSNIVRVFAERPAGVQLDVGDDSVSVVLRCANGSVATLQYLATGDAEMPKEYIEVSGAGRSATLDNFRELTVYRQGKRSVESWSVVDKGHVSEVKAFMAAVGARTGSPIRAEESLHVTRVTFGIEESLRKGAPISVGPRT